MGVGKRILSVNESPLLTCLFYSFLRQRDFENSYFVWELQGHKFSPCKCTETIRDWTHLEKTWITFITVTLAGSRPSSFPAIRSTPTLTWKLFSTGLVGFSLFCFGKRRGKWRSETSGVALLKETCSFRHFAARFYSKFLFCEVAGGFSHIQIKKKKNLRQSTKLST